MRLPKTEVNRLFGLDLGDWSILLLGLLLMAILVVLT
jgi:hypothetical protein